MPDGNFKDFQGQRPQLTRDRGRSDVADSLELEEVQKRAVSDSVELLHGPESVDYTKDELIVLTQVRDSKPYLKSFVEHYLALGVKHLVFLDNSSTDGTVEALKEYANVTVLRTALPYRAYNVAMKQYLIERFGRGRWSLLVDVDELFDYPFSDVVRLQDLLGYLNENSYTAVVAHMLDMFPEGPISRDGPLPEDEPLKEKYHYYDVSGVRRQSYNVAKNTGNVVSNQDIEILRDGIRWTLFGNTALLMKHPLIFLDEELRPMDLSDHWVANARVADFSSVLYHYKFTDRFHEDTQRSVKERNRSDDGTRRYGKFLQVLDNNPSLQIRQQSAKQLESTDDLVSDGFVVISGDYLDFVKQASGGGDGADSSLAERIDSADQARRRLTEARRKRQEEITSQSSGNKFSKNLERLDVPDTPELERVQRFLLRYDVRLLHGPAEVEYDKDELVVLCLLRNGRPYVRSFIEHYFAMGAKHLVFLDNGSTDGTVEALKEYEDVTVFYSEQPFKRYQLLMRQYLVERFGKGRWSLLVDVDELFDYPFSNIVSLKELLGYLNQNSYTALVAHMLDMFPEGPLSEGAAGDVPLKELHRFYDLSNTSSYDYQGAKGFGNVVSNEGIEILQGGVQRTLFNLHPLLTKHPLVFYDNEMSPVDHSEHWAGNARVADFTGVLLHYKLLGLHDLVPREVRERRYVNRHGKYDKYLKVLEQSPSLRVKNETSRELRNANDLIGTQYNSISEEYIRFVELKEQEKGAVLAHGAPNKLLEPLLRAGADACRVRRRAGNLQNRVNQLQQQANQQQAKLQQANQSRAELDKERREKATLEYRNDNLEAHSQNLEHQLKAVQASKAWKVMSVLGYLKRRSAEGLSGITARLRSNK